MADVKSVGKKFVCGLNSGFQFGLSCVKIETAQNINIFFTSLKHQIWRRYNYFLNKEEVAESIKKRKGECKRCGLCCQTSIRCPKFFTDESGLAMCKIHDHKPQMCKIYPCNGRDIFPHLKDKCGFWYEE